MPRYSLLWLLLAVLATPAVGQNPQATETYGSGQPGLQARQLQAQSGRTADTGIGEVGERQTKDTSAANIAPMGRVENRLSNRIHGRYNNRLDRFQYPDVTGSAAFTAAEKETRKPNQ